MNFLISGKYSTKMCDALKSKKTINILKSKGLEEIDLSYRLMNFIQTPMKFFDADTSILLEEVSREYIEDNLDTIPNIDEKYTFSGYVKPNEKVGDMVKLENTKMLGHRVMPISFYGLKFTGETKVLKTGEMFVFELQSSTDAEYIRGCSGAPILDSKGNLVALVSERHTRKANKYKGARGKTLIYGLNLKKYKLVFDIEIQ